MRPPFDTTVEAASVKALDAVPSANDVEAEAAAVEAAAAEAAAAEVAVAEAVATRAAAEAAWAAAEAARAAAAEAARVSAMGAASGHFGSRFHGVDWLVRQDDALRALELTQPGWDPAEAEGAADGSSGQLTLCEGNSRQKQPKRQAVGGEWWAAIFGRIDQLRCGIDRPKPTREDAAQVCSPGSSYSAHPQPVENRPARGASMPALASPGSERSEPDSEAHRLSV